ncbi:MAG: response regulator transcription factor [Caldilineaceae bacterium]
MGSTKVYKIYIVEDHPLMLRTLSEFMRRMLGFEVCGAAHSAEEALEALSLENIMPDLVLIDMSLPEMNGADLVRHIREQWPTLPCVIFSGHSEAIYVNQALAAGASGYILKGKPKELRGALEQVLSGHLYLSESLGLESSL